MYVIFNPPNIHPDGTLCILPCFREKLEQKSCSTYIQTGLWETKKHTQHKQEKHRILPLFVKWKIWAFYWAQCHWQRSKKRPQREWRVLATLGPDDHLLCAVKVPVGRLRMKTEVAKMERWDRKAAVFPSFQNEIQRIAFQKKPLTRIKQTGEAFQGSAVRGLFIYTIGGD